MTRLAIRMPKMSMTMTEGEVSGWSMQVGDTITEGDVVCEVMTDKVDMEVEATVGGTLVEIVHDSGMVPVGEVIGWVEGEDTGGGFGDLLSDPGPASADTPTDAPDALPAEPAPAPPPPDPTPEPQPAAAPVVEQGGPPGPSVVETTPAEAPPAPEPDPAPVRTGPVPAIPRARGMALEHGLDLAAITGTGSDGLVLVPDVEQHLAQRAAPAAAVAAPAPAPIPPAARPRSDGVAPDRRAAVRAVVARTMTPSAAVPQFTVWREVELDAADTQRRGLSWTTVLLRAYAASLRQVPELLSRWEDDGPTEPAAPAVALAVATDRGLLVPTFVEPDRGSAEDLDEEVRAVVRTAHSGRLDPRYMRPANGSLSNLGGLDVDRFQALLTPPQASVMSLGSVRRRPIAVPGGVGTALTVHVGLTVDHRVADGVHAAQLLQRFAERLSGVL